MSNIMLEKACRVPKLVSSRLLLGTPHLLGSSLLSSLMSSCCVLSSVLVKVTIGSEAAASRGKLPTFIPHKKNMKTIGAFYKKIKKQDCMGISN